jgi:hypothetical protein
MSQGRRYRRVHLNAPLRHVTFADTFSNRNAGTLDRNKLQHPCSGVTPLVMNKGKDGAKLLSNGFIDPRKKEQTN